MKWNVFVFCVLHIFQNFPCMLGEKSKSVIFSRVYVCVKAKLTLVSFFFTFLTKHLSLKLRCSVYYFFWLAVLNFCPWMQNPAVLYFAVWIGIFHGWMCEPKGWHNIFIFMFYALLMQILKSCFCAIISCVQSMCAIFFAFSAKGQRQNGPRVEFSLPK